MSSVILLPLLFAWMSAPQAADRVVGLLSLPEVFGKGPCDTFTPQEVLLYSAPDSRDVMGSIRVDKYWTFPAEGGCQGLTVNVHHRRDGRVSELPTKEYEYEAAAAIVLQQRDRWFKLRLADGAAWVLGSERDEFFSLEKLLTRNETASLTDVWDGRLAASPGKRVERVPRDPRPDDVRVLGFRRVGDQVWTEVELLSHSRCKSNDEPRVMRRGWMLAHDRSGEPTIGSPRAAADHQESIGSFRRCLSRSINAAALAELAIASATAIHSTCR